MSETSAQIASLADGMRDAIEAFRRDELEIDRLAWHLKSSIAALRHVADQAWADELKGLWNQLEVINAFYLESGRPSLSPEERKDVDEVLDELAAALVAY